MRRLVRILSIVGCLSIVSADAQALPMLQLDIIGGTYDESTQTITSTGSSFTLVALLTLQPGDTLDPSATYYISAALTPQTGPTDSSIGSFTFNGSTIDVTSDMQYGVPPIEGAHEAIKDAGDLSQHGIYPTFFSEFAFNFSSTQLTESYDSATSPGGLTPTSATTDISYYQLFNVTMALPEPYELHFDLYDTYFRSACANSIRRTSCTSLSDEDVDHFAPFSHDAQSGDLPPIPEPASLVLLATGLVLSARRLRRSVKARQS